MLEINIKIRAVLVRNNIGFIYLYIDVFFFSSHFQEKNRNDGSELREIGETYEGKKERRRKNYECRKND